MSESHGLCRSCQAIFVRPEAFQILLRDRVRFSKPAWSVLASARRNCPSCMLVHWTTTSSCIFSHFVNKKFLTLDLRLVNVSVINGRHMHLIAEVVGEPETNERFLAVTEHDDPAAFSTDSRLMSNLELACCWLKDCSNSHERCKIGRKRHIPSRLLLVPPNDSIDTLKLVETSASDYDYAALSYCWGAETPKGLTRDKLSKYYNSICEEDLPQTIQDAITVTRSLNLRFLWVDSYCIVQDSPEDKKREIRRMREIYNSSIVTILASRASSACDGFLNQNGIGTYFKIPIQIDDQRVGNFYFKYWAHHQRHHGSEPVDCRGWVLQETLLSQRTICFPSNSHQIYWTCNTVSQSDSGQVDPRLTVVRDEHKRIFKQEWLESVASENRLPLSRLYRRWNDIVHDYSRRNLSEQGDKLIGIGGIAAAFGDVWDGSYYAGLWSQFMPTQLLWRVLAESNDKSTWGRRHKSYTAPSWAWASLDGPLELPSGFSSGISCVEILNIEVAYIDPANHFGQAIAGCINLKGPLRQVRIQSGQLYRIDEPSAQKALIRTFLDEGRPWRSLTAWSLCINQREQESDLDETPTSEDSFCFSNYSMGLLLTATEVEDTYERIGVWVSQVDELDDWLKDCPLQSVTII